MKYHMRMKMQTLNGHSRSRISWQSSFLLGDVVNNRSLCLILNILTQNCLNPAVKWTGTPLWEWRAWPWDTPTPQNFKLSWATRAINPIFVFLAVENAGLKNNVVCSTLGDSGWLLQKHTLNKDWFPATYILVWSKLNNAIHPWPMHTSRDRPDLRGQDIGTSLSISAP